MDSDKERYYHAQAAKLDPRRRWQAMALWPVVFRYGDRLRMEFEYRHGAYLIDLYIPAVRLAVEVDEPHHARQREADAARQAAIEAGLGCDFVRVRVGDAPGLFAQLGTLFDEIDRRVDALAPAPWSVPARPAAAGSEPGGGGYADRNRRRLADGRIAELVEEMKADLRALGIGVTDDPGPVVSSNGELGFSAHLPGITFCVSVRPNRQAKLIVTSSEPGAVSALGITLDGPMRGKVDYWVVNEFGGRFGTDEVTGQLATYSQVLGDRGR